MSYQKKIFAINGSHRSEKGFTEIVLRRFIQGAESANAQCDVLYPSRQKIITCESCGKCLFETPGECKYKDDMESIIQKIEAVDLIVFASPVYFDCMSSDLKKMIERLRSTLDAYFEFRDGRSYHLKKSKKRQNIVTIFTAGNPEMESFDSIRRVFNRIIDNMGWQLRGEFMFPASHLLVTEPNLLSKQLEAVAMCGQAFASKGIIGKELLGAANKGYIDNPEIVLNHVTQTILKMRKNNNPSFTVGERAGRPVR